jgi:DNA (cytosine-5)-methyltransferase 1
MLTFGSLFAGIGGMDLGLERAGMVCKWQVEIDDYATKVLEKHWPNAHRERDIRECGKHNLEYVDVICGGFPCQDISVCKRNACGILGAKSGLFRELERVICELQPRVAVIENSPALTVRGLGTVLKGLAQAGYDAEWQTLSCWPFGSHHKRERMYIVAYRPDANRYRWERRSITGCKPWSNAQFTRLVRGVLRDSVSAGKHGRVSDGVPSRAHRLRGLGSAVVPQVAEYIGLHVVEMLEAR